MRQVSFLAIGIATSLWADGRQWAHGIQCRTDSWAVLSTRTAVAQLVAREGWFDTLSPGTTRRAWSGCRRRGADERVLTAGPAVDQWPH